MALVACTPPVDPAPTRAGEVVVSVDVGFGSLNAATARGRLPGSVLVRSAVQDGFFSLAEDGTAVPDESFGTVERIDDDPLTVRYTIEPTARWSDGVPVTADDLLLEWAARSGAFDDVVPRLGDDGEVLNTAELDAGVAFAATSPALVHVEQRPTLDDEGRLVVVYAQPVPDWQLALDVNLPAHVLGTAALGAETDPAAAVTAAITEGDPVALSSIAHAWRTAWDDDVLAGSVADAVTTGPYVVAAVLPDERVELERNPQYRGSRPARYDALVVRSDLHPLDQVDGLVAGTVDVAAPTVSADVVAALDEAGARVLTAPDAAWQLVAQTAGGGVLDASDDAGALLREAFWRAVPRDAAADALDAAGRPDAVADAPVLPQVGVQPSGAGGDDPAGAAALVARSGASTPVRVRVLVADGGPQVLDALAAAEADAGFEVVPVEAVDAWRDPGAWDVALVRVGQADLPAATVGATWSSGGAANLTGWSDPSVDDALTDLAAVVDPGALPAAYDEVARRLTAQHALLPLLTTPALTAVADGDVDGAAGAPRVAGVGALRLARADLTDWWSWAAEPVAGRGG